MNLSREPLLVRGALTGLVTLLIHLAVLRGWLSVESASEESVALVVDALGLMVALVWSRGAVTPVADPVIVTKTATRVNEVVTDKTDSGWQPAPPQAWELELARSTSTL